TALARDHAADRPAFERKYRYRVLTVTGRLSGKASAALLVLEGDETDRPLKVHCHFGTLGLRDADAAAVYTLRGLYTGPRGAGATRLDTGERSGRKKKGVPRLRAASSPHARGRTLIYDAVISPPQSKTRLPLVVRQVRTEKDRGVTEAVVTHRAT